MVPDWNPVGTCSVSIDDDAFIKSAMPKIAPTLTDMEGVFVAGVAAGPKDIVDTIAEAGAAAMEASIYLKEFKREKAA
jgi:heterodisulfide reductase subunit A